MDVSKQVGEKTNVRIAIKNLIVDTAGQRRDTNQDQRKLLPPKKR